MSSTVSPLLGVFTATLLATIACQDDPATEPAPAVKPAPTLPLPAAGDPLTWVNPLIGSKGPGNVFVGASLPHGAIKLGPDTANGGGSLEGYTYESSKIEGFSHTHLDGPGGSAYGYSQVLLLPQAGTLVVEEGKRPVPFDRASEVLTPAYYAATLGTAKIRAEVTTTAHCGRHRYTFAPGTTGAERPRILVDLGHTRGDSTGGHVEVGGAGLRARADYTVHPVLTTLLSQTSPATGLATVFVSAKFSRPIVAVGTAAEGKVLAKADPAGSAVLSQDGQYLVAWTEFAPEAAKETTVEACVCLSWLSQDTADGYANSVACTASFEETRSASESAWRALLDRVRVEGASAAERIRLYTALYHSLLQPADYSEQGQFWNGMTNPPKIQSTEGRRYFTDDWCSWDTARTTHPLLTLIVPEVVEDMAQSLVWQGQANGFLPKCTWQATGDSRVMTANFPYATLAAAIAKNLRGFDTKAALALMVKGAMEDVFPFGDKGGCGYFNQGTPPSYVENGWVASECDTGQAASMTLEHAYHDWCLAEAADALGDSATAKKFRARSGNWRNQWNPVHRFPQSRRADGSWVEPFDPKSMLGFTEANAWIYQWFVPHDPCGLADALGGRKAAIQRLDEFFAGHFDMSNEPDFHAPWLYQDLGRPDRTVEVLDGLLKQHFSSDPGGLPGNDDAGATSAWYALAALGLYPVAPGDDWWRISTPLYAKSSLVVGKAVVRIETTATQSGDRYITAASWNGKALVEPRIRHLELAKGGVLLLQLGAKPAQWAQQGLCPSLAP